MSITRLEPIAQTQNSPVDLIAYPGDARYEAARQAWNLSIDQHPAATVMAQSSADIAAAVRYAQQEKLPSPCKPPVMARAARPTERCSLTHHR